MVDVLSDVLEDDLEIKYKIIQLAKYLIMVEYLGDFFTLKRAREKFQTLENKKTLERYKEK